LGVPGKERAQLTGGAFFRIFIINDPPLLYIALLFSTGINAQIITTFGGIGTAGDSGDGGPATSASISGFTTGTFDNNGNFYFAERGQHKIRKISNLGIITTIAGTGISGYSGDGGPASTAQLNNPIQVTIDAYNNLYIADLDNNRIRKISYSTGIITTVAGNGISGYSGDGGPATNASLNGPTGICVDPFGNVYISEISSSIIRKVNTLGIVSTYAGIAYSGGDSGDGGPATIATIGSPEGICSDMHGNIFISTAGKIRKIIAGTGSIISLAGTFTPGFSGDSGPAFVAQLNSPFSVAVDKYGNVFIADANNNRIRYIDNAGIINTIIGTGIPGYSGDGSLASNSEINHPEGVMLDSCGNIYVSDLFNFRIRKITFPHCGYLSVENEIAHNFAIYPNPAYDILNIDVLKTPSIYHLQNIIGATLRQGTLQQGNNTISIQSLPPGMYLLQLTDEEGNKTVKKVVKD